MTEENQTQSQTHADAPVSIEPPALVQPSLSIGEALIEKRFSLRLTRDDITARLKYSTRLIEALETEHWDELPRGLALRGLIRGYTRMLGIDSQQLEDLLKDRIGVIGGGIANHTSTRSLAAHETEKTQHSSIGWVVLIVLVVFAAIAIAIWQGVIPKSMLPQWIGALLA